MNKQQTTQDQRHDELAWLRRRVDELETIAVEQRETIKTLRDSEARYRLLADNAPDIVWSADLSGRLTYISPSVECSLGYSAAEMAQKTLDQLVTPASLLVAQAELRRLIEQAGSDPCAQCRFDVELRRSDGSTVWMEAICNAMRDPTGQVIGVMGTVRDTSKRQLAEQNLQWELRVSAALSALYRPLIESSSLEEISGEALQQASALVGSAYGYISTYDPSSGDQLCHNLSEMAAAQAVVPELPQMSVMANANGSKKSELWGYALSTGQAFYTNDAEHHPARRELPADHVPITRFLAAPIWLGDQIVGQIALANPPYDFTDQHLDAVRRLADLYTLAIQRKQVEAEREKLIEDLNAFAHSVAHDLKNPLNVVLNVFDILSTMYQGDPVLAEYLELALLSSQKLNRIIDDLLLLAGVRSQDVPIGPLDMCSIVDNAMLTLSHTIEQFHGEVICPNEWPVALGYASWIEQVWVNYISNALKYGGSPPRVEIGATPQDDGTIRFWVRDNGLGIDPKSQALLFTPFTRLENTGSTGYGLGLSIVQRIIKRLGGRVDVESELGKGSVFSFTLPAALEPPADLSKQLTAENAGGTEA